MSVASMLDACHDDVGPTVLLLKSGNRIFGGYASDSWKDDGASFGDSKSFLFSVSLDLKFPFHGRKLLPAPPKIVGDDIPIEAHNNTVPSLVAGKDFVQFGVGDLVLRKGLSNCSSELEGSYGLGLRRGSSEASTILAGSKTFAVDEIELWHVA